MSRNPDLHHRRSIRLREYDYAAPGAYFITICTRNREPLFGKIADGIMRLNEMGRIVESIWYQIPAHFPRVELDALVVMPDHVHGIIAITDAVCGSVGAGSSRPCIPSKPPISNAVTPYQTNVEPPPDSGAGKPRPYNAFTPIHSDSRTLGQVVAYWKYQAAKHINVSRGSPGNPVWQRNYFEHVIRNEQSLNRIRRYIAENPARWRGSPRPPVLTSEPANPPSPNPP